LAFGKKVLKSDFDGASMKLEVVFDILHQTLLLRKSLDNTFVNYKLWILQSFMKGFKRKSPENVFVNFCRYHNTIVI